jgi:RNA polymerase sigma-70 factor (family 1)
MYVKSDDLLLEQLREGKMNAFDGIFHKYFKFLVASAYLYIKDEQEAKDIVQDLLFEFWNKKLYLKLEGDIKGYLYRSVQNKCINYYRKKQIEKQRSISFVQELHGQTDEDFSQIEKELEELEFALEDLPPQRKEALKQVYIEEKKYQEAADAMGISLNTLKTHLKIGIKNLREKLQNN